MKKVLSQHKEAEAVEQESFIIPSSFCLAPDLQMQKIAKNLFPRFLFLPSSQKLSQKSEVQINFGIVVVSAVVVVVIVIMVGVIVVVVVDVIVIIVVGVVVVIVIVVVGVVVVVVDGI